VTFNSLQYAVFLPAVFLVYWRLRRREQNVLLLAASYLFYGLFDWRFLGLLLISTITDYTVGRVLERTTEDRRRLQVFVCSLVVNLGILGFFKYFDFFVTDGSKFLAHLGVHLAPPLLRIILPVGISFYTFHGISYSFDVYRKRIAPTHDLLAFAVFVAFFPQLVAGPIGRAHLQLPQFENDRVHPDRHRVQQALLMIIQGLFKKIVIADALAPFVNTAFTHPEANSSATLILGAWAFAFQIYGDFSGYTDIARGSAWLLGINLPENFNQPYLSRSITEFWRRWHISLSTWLRDYLYIPLGGNKGSPIATYRNLFLTMLIGGLWHGAAITFVVWGGWHGFLLAFERRFTPARDEDWQRKWRWPIDAIRAFVTFQLVCVGWVLFRATTISGAAHYFKGILKLHRGSVDPHFVLALACAVVAMGIIDLAQRIKLDQAAISTWRPLLRGSTYGFMLVAIILFSGETPVPFIYFRF
jgi:alginate O-acetyltransferase complex protein AlgI